MAISRKRTVLVALLLAGSVLVGAGASLSVEQGLPSVDALRDWRPSALTTIYAMDGSVLSRIGEQKRIVIPYDRIPKRFLDAVIATEDQHFYQHMGVDPMGIARALVTNVSSGRLRSQGGSTITQQLARNLFLQPDKTLSRKVQEALLALQIERAYSKDEILTFYSNQVYLGHGRYGIEAASQHFFSRPAETLSLAQCALLAGIVQSPERLSPIRHPDRAMRRREHVLDRLEAEGLITASEAGAARAEPITLLVSNDEGTMGHYFIEEVRRELVKTYGEEALYGGGLSVETTLDPKAQQAAEKALAHGILTAATRRGFRPSWRSVAKEAGLAAYRDPSWPAGPPEPGRAFPALVMSATSTGATVRIDRYHGAIDATQIAWTGRAAVSAVLKPGDLVPVRVETRDDAALRVQVTLIPSPSVEGALVALDPKSGEVRALVGGFDYARSEFDRAVQARRQAGSAFKPFLFSAAIDSGMTASQTLFDEPTVLFDEQTRQPYQPENYYRQYSGLLTLRETLEESRNIASVILLNDVGYAPVIARAHAMGITSPLEPYPSMALGAFEVSLLEMTSAYGVFANQGIRVAPHWIRRVRDRAGNLLQEAKPELQEVMKPETAFVTTWMLKGVAEEGTAARARELNRPLAGKTGTTDDYSDAWFVGFSPSLVCGVWIGTDKKETLGSGQTGAVAALPVWIDFMGAALDGTPPEEFVRPSGVELVPVDRRTGLRASGESGCDVADVILEAFVAGTEPVSYCSDSDHARLRLPYYLQRFPLNARGELVAGADELAQVLQSGPGARLASDGGALAFFSENGTATVPLALDQDGRAQLERLLAAPPAPVEEGLGPWYGTDGRTARVVPIRRE